MTVHIEWNHPVKGRIVEEVCTEHEHQVTDALKILGIGCSATYGQTGICWRCVYVGHPFRTWMDELDIPSMFGDKKHDAQD